MSVLNLLLGAGGGVKGWIGLLGGASADIGLGAAVDSSGNLFVVGYSNSSGSNDIQLAKYNEFGVIQWQRKLGDGLGDLATGVGIDGSGNVYVSGASGTKGVVAKYNTSGTIQWQKNLTAALNASFNGIAVSSSGDVYAIGASTIATDNIGLQLVKYNSSGALQWQRRVTDPAGTSTPDDSGSAVAVDSSGNVYVGGYDGYGNMPVAKFNSSGTIQWQQVRNVSEFNGISVDSLGNSYACGYVSGGFGSFDFLLFKYNTSGVLQWQRRLGGASSDVPYETAVDSLNNVYIVGVSESSGQIAKYDSSGAIQWQRSLSGPSTTQLRSVFADALGNLYVCGLATVGGTNDFVFAKLPADGSATGTYSVGGYSFTYAASSLSESASSTSGAAGSKNVATSSLTDATSTLTSATSTLTSSVTTI